MKKFQKWWVGLMLICGLGIFVSCTDNDNEDENPVVELLQDGEWTGSGEGRSGSIIAKVVVENHQVTQSA